MPNFKSIIFLGIALIIGAGLTFVGEQVYWNAKLNAEFAEKDKLIADLKQSSDALKQSNEQLSVLNSHMTATLNDAKGIVNDLGNNTDGSIERMKRIIAALKRLKEVLAQ